MTCIKLQNVEIPVDVAEFGPPCWDRVLRFYPRWRAEVAEPRSIQEYLLLYAKELERLGREGGTHEKLSSDEWIAEYIRHFGILHLEDVVRCSAELDELMSFDVDWMQAGKPSPNGRVYTQAALEQLVQDQEKSIREARALVQLGDLHETTGVRLKDVAGRIESLVLEEGVMRAKVRVLDTPMGQVLKGFRREPHLLKLLPMMLGNPDENQVVHRVVVCGWALVALRAAAA